MSTLRSAKARTYRVALEGFSEFERGMLASFFRLAERHTPAYEHVTDSTQSDLIVANADQAQLLERIVATRRVNDTVFVGAKAPREAIARVERPIEPTQILRELDQLVALRTVRIGLDLELPVAGLEAMPNSVDLLLHDISPQMTDSTADDMPHPGHGGGRAVLVVDDSPIARKFLDARLRRLGYAVQSAASGEYALELAARERFAIVFLDVGLAPADTADTAEAQLDGLQVCQRIRQRAQQRDELPPAVVLVTGSTSSSERVRGSLAGCDAYLTKPLLDAEFFEVLGTVDPLFRPQAVGAIG